MNALPPSLRRKHVLDGIPIVGVTGVNGAGKTLIAVHKAIRDMAHGRDVYSTVPIHSEWGNSKPIASLRQLLSLEDSTLLLDEVAVIFSSRSSTNLPPEVVALLQTLRHKRNTLIWTAPAWMRCDNLLREVTQAVLNVWPVPVARANDGSPWPRPRVVMGGLMDTSVGKTDAAPTKVLRRRFIRLAGSPAFGAYDTHADTPLLGRHLQPGRCVDCGGTIKIPVHSRERHDELGLPYYDEDPAAIVARASADIDHSGHMFAETE